MNRIKCAALVLLAILLSGCDPQCIIECDYEAVAINKEGAIIATGGYTSLFMCLRSLNDSTPLEGEVIVGCRKNEVPEP